MSEEKFYEALKRLMKKYESASSSPMNIENMPQDFIRQLIKGAVGIEISIEKREGKWKLSQNRDDESAGNVIRELEKLQNDAARSIAAEMKKLRESLH